MEFCYHKVENNEVDIYIDIPSSKQVNDYKILLHAKVNNNKQFIELDEGLAVNSWFSKISKFSKFSLIYIVFVCFMQLLTNPSNIFTSQ